MSQTASTECGQLSPMLDWDVAADAENIRPGSIELQAVVHRAWYDKMVARPSEKWLKGKPFWRATCMDKFELLLGRPFYGSVLEIGAGTALCSARISQRPDVERVTALDYERFMIDEQMPETFRRFEARTEKIERAYGSFNRIPRRDFYDFIVGVGAMHHSEDLVVSFKSLHDALKPGGVALISDVCMTDGTTNRFLADAYESVSASDAERYGRPVKMKENGDHWYRLAEWLAAAWRVGFETLPIMFDHERGAPADDAIFAKPRAFDGFSVQTYQPFFAKDQQYDKMFLVLQRPDANGATPIVSR